MNKIHDRLRQYWLVACDASQLRDRPMGVVVLGTPLVLYRSLNCIVAAEDRCPHRNAPLSHGTIHSGTLRCPYHGWRFGHEGRCVDAPGTCDSVAPAISLRRWNAVESNGWVWVSEQQDAPKLAAYCPELANAEGYRGFSMTTQLESNLADAIENLLDGTHTPFVHSGLVRSEHAKQSFTAVVRRHEHCIEAEYRGESKQNGFISKLFEPDREVSFGRFIPPCTAELEYRSKHRVELKVVAHFTPTEKDKLKVFVKCYLPNGRIPASFRYAVIRPFFRRVLEQDRKILELQQQNVSRFDGPCYVNWTADLLRPWIDAWLATGSFPSQPDGPNEVRFLL